MPNLWNSPPRFTIGTMQRFAQHKRMAGFLFRVLRLSQPIVHLWINFDAAPPANCSVAAVVVTFRPLMPQQRRPVAILLPVCPSAALRIVAKRCTISVYRNRITRCFNIAVKLLQFCHQKQTDIRDDLSRNAFRGINI